MTVLQAIFSVVMLVCGGGRPVFRSPANSLPACLVLLSFGALSLNQAQADPLQAGNFSFSISSSAPLGGSCTGPDDDNCAHILNSITIGGVTYSDFTVPSGFSVSGFPIGANVQSRIHNVPGDFQLSSPTYAADMLANVFSDQDLNRYQQVDSGAISGASVFTYPAPIPATNEYFFITTERNGNNDQIVEAFDQNGVSLGIVTIDSNSADYTNTGVDVGFNQDSFIAVIPMSEFADVTDPSRRVLSVRISYTGNDGADHKTFIVGESVTVTAVDDSPAALDGLAGGTTPGSVLDNDTLNGAAIANPADVVLTPGVAPAPTAGSITMNADGTITVAAGTTAGTYSYPYQICEALNPTNCDTATATVIVGAPAIDAVDDSPAALDGLAGGTTPGSVLDNDTLNGAAIANPADVVLTPGAAPVPTAGSITMNADGTITVAAGTTVGTYSYPYQICEALNPTNCDTATATVVVSETDLIAEIEEDLLAILEDDLAATITRQSQQMNGYASDALDRLRTRTAPACQAAVNERLRDETLLFDTDRATIRPQSQRAFDDIAQILGTCAGSRFEIAGHTDSDASEAYNLRLSQRRVEAVLRALSERGVDTEGFRARGYGESRPIASNASEAGKALNRRVEFIAIDGHEDFAACDEAAPDIRGFDASANERGVSVDGHLRTENRDCARHAWEIVEGSVKYTETDSGHAQSMVNLSFRRERFTDTDSVRGYFVGLYVSENDISDLATGEINGIGVNAGLYGADQLRNGLFLDYYLGAALGRHTFDLAFDRSVGTIDASGNYHYVAGFAGAALSGALQLGQRTVTPRVGLDYAYAPGADVDVLAELDDVSQSGDLELGRLSGGRVFAEIRDAYLINGGATLFALTPRFACYQSLGSFDGDCSIGGSLEFSSVDEEDDLIYSVKIDGERGNNFSSVSVTGSMSKRLGRGAVHADATMGEQGAFRLGGRLELAF